MSDWRDSVSEERPAFGLGDLEEGDEIVGTFLDEGKLTDTRHGEALQIGFAVESVPDGFTTMNDSDVTAGEDYNILSSSSRFKFELKEYASELTGATVTITASGDGFDRTYHIE